MKKAAKKSKVAPKKATFMDRLPKNHGERLELMIRMTEKHVKPGSRDTTMANQADRLKAELVEWKKANS